MKNIRTPRLAVSCLAALALVGVAACGGGSGSASSNDTIKIGAILAQTGPAAVVGSTEVKALKTFVKEHNANGGYHGHRIKLKIIDGKSDPAHATDVMRKLISSFQPDAIIGPSVTATCYATEPITRAVPVVQYCLSGAPLAPEHPYYFSALAPSDRVLADLPAHWMVKNDFEKVGFIGTTDASGQLYKREYTKAVEGANLTDAGQEVYSPSTTDVTAQLTKLRSSGAEALYLGTTGSGVIPVLKGLQQLGWDVPVITGEGSVTSDVAKQVKHLLPEAGFYGPGEAPEVFDQLPPNFPDDVRKRAEKFGQTWVIEGGNPPDWSAAATYDTLNILLETIAAVGSNAEKMLNYMTSHTFTGALFTYDFSDRDHRGSKYLGLVVRFTANEERPFKLVEYYPHLPRYTQK